MKDKKLEIRMGDGSEGAHWYAPPGPFGDETRCAYEIEMSTKPGQFRNVNLRDARKFGFYPSVSKICRIPEQEGLQRWIQHQVALSASTLPGISEVGDEREWFAAIKKDASEQAAKAAEGGKAIHAAIEDYFETGRMDLEYAKHVDAAREAMDEIVDHQPWELEEFSVEKACSHYYGYGGRVDLYSTDRNVVVDYKTKEFDEDDKLGIFPNQSMQLVAYREALGMSTARCFTVYISRDNEGLFRVIEHPEKKLQKAWLGFVSLLYYWQGQNDMERLAKPWEITL